MRQLLFILAILAFSCAVQCKATEWDNFKKKDLLSMLKSKEDSYVALFYKDSCVDECALDKEVLEKEADKLEASTSNLSVKFIEYSRYPATAREVDIPTDSSALFLIFKGHLIRIVGKSLRDKNINVADHITNMVKRAPQELTSLGELNKIKKSNDFIFVFYGNKESKRWSEIELLAKMEEDIPIYFTDNKVLAEKLEFKKQNKFYMYDVQREEAVAAPYVYYDDLVKYVRLAAMPFLQPLNKEAFAKTSQYPVYPALFLTTKDRATEAEATRELEKLIPTIRSNFHSYKLNDLNTELDEEIDGLCTKKDGNTGILRLCILIKFEGHHVRYILNSKEVNAKEISKFIEGFSQGTTLPYYVSEKIAAKFDGQARNLNAYGLENFLMPTDKHTALRFVLYYSSDDKAYERGTGLHKAFEKLASEHSGKGRSQFAKFDLAKNDNVEGVPIKPPCIVALRALGDEFRELLEISGPEDFSKFGKFVKQTNKKWSDELESHLGKNEYPTDL